MSTPGNPSVTLRPSVSDPELARQRQRKAARRTVARWSKRVALALVAAGVAGAIAVAWIPKPVEVDAGVARRTTLRVFVEEDGRTRVRERYVVTAPASGKLRRIGLEAGDRVAAGAEVARIAPPDPAMLDEHTRADAEARLAGALSRERQTASAALRARAARDLAVREAQRARALGDAVTAAERDRIELQERVAAADLTSAELGQRVAAAEVRSARAALGLLAPAAADDVVVVAPAAGQVLRVVRESEGPVAAGAALVEIGDARALEVVVDVLSSDAVRVPVGAPVTLSQWGSEPLHGQVRAIEPSAFTRVSALGVEEQRVNVIVTVDDAPPALGDGFRVEASIQTWEGRDVLTVPDSAVFRERDGFAVYAIVAGRARLRPVELGRRGRLEVQVVTGLDEGTGVVLYPGDRVRDGVKVAAR